jgi:alkanesulfonate monooxygenase SsuD/methylene tetrahydromethanopterin reductase-like flavin-dependent oxidoreductase (luciferase family)
MWRGEPLNANKLRDLSVKLEDVGYYSLLLPFHSKSPDYLIKSAAALIPGNKLKYMIALRPYHISPQFCAMVTEGYNQIDPNRIIFNWIAGDFHNREEEGSQVDVFGSTKEIDDIVKRTTFLRNFVDQYNSFGIVTEKPEMIFSGFSDYTLETVKMFNGTSLCMIDDYRNNLNKFNEIDKKMVSVNPIILESNDDVEEYKEKISSINPRSIETTIIGDRKTVKEKLLDLKNEGITDILLYTNMPNFPGLTHAINRTNDILVNDLIKEINQGR